MNNLKNLKKPALIEIAKKAKLRGYSKLNKKQLIQLIKKNKGVSVSLTDKNNNPNDNRVYVNVYCNDAHRQQTGALKTNKFITEQNLQQQPVFKAQQSQQSQQPVKKFAPVQTTKPIKKVPPQKISARAQKLRDKTEAELSKLPKSQVSSDFKSRLEDIFRKR